MSECVHNPYDPRNTLVVESHWAAGTRIRCSVCFGCAAVDKHGAIKPEDCECHRAAPESPPSNEYLYLCEKCAPNGLSAEEFATKPLTATCLVCGADAERWYMSTRRVLIALLKERKRVHETAGQEFMYCPGAALLRCELRYCIHNGCCLVRDGSCAHRPLDADTLVKARELNAELRRAAKTAAPRGGILGTNCPYGNADCPHCAAGPSEPAVALEEHSLSAKRQFDKYHAMQTLLVRIANSPSGFSEDARKLLAGEF